MFYQKIKQCFSYSVYLASFVISEFTYSDTDLTRNRKLPADKLTTFPVSQGPSSTKNELLDFLDMDPQSPTASVLNQQRVKLSPDVLEAAFRHFNHFASLYDQKKLCCHFLVANDSTFTFFGEPAFAPEEYHVFEGHLIKGLYSMHPSTFYNLQKHTYSDALIQPIHQKSKFSASCEMVNHRDLLTGTKDVFIGDRDYCSCDNVAHVKEKGQHFLFRVKDIHSKELVGNFEFPDAGSPDIQVNVTLIHGHKKKISIKEGYYRCFVDATVSFDYAAYGSLDTYDLSFRIVRFLILDDSHECIVTNLSSDEFPSEQIKPLHYARQAIEGSFRKLKYTVGLGNFHAYKPGYIKQEI